MAWEHELEAALSAAAAATAVIREHYGNLAARQDAPADVTTQTDRASQDVILRRLADEFPADGFRAEERTPALEKLKTAGERLWVIDPIDGTRGFVTKNGEFSVMIALVVGGDAVVGVVAEPAHERVTFATRGGGCHQQLGSGVAKPVAVSRTATLDKATLIQSHVKAESGPAPEVKAVGPARVVETYSAGVKLARVADGSADLYVCSYAAMNDWDLAAGHALVTAAGGRVTKLDGGDIRYGGEAPTQLGGLLATNGVLHAAAVESLRRRTAT